MISDTQPADTSNPKQPNRGGDKSRVPARVYALDHQGTIHVFPCLATCLANGEIWELKNDMQEKYHELFTNICMKFRGQNFFKGERV